VNTQLFLRVNRAKKPIDKWDADSNQYARKLSEKDKPHCLISSGMAAFSFRAAYGLRCEQRNCSTSVAGREIGGDG
jgi:glutamine cyclotransferase